MTVETIEQSLDKAAVRYDRDGDQHYDVISAFIKSVRGSDVDAALHYLARMLVAGEDPRFVARRLMILASEDIGMADPTALQTAVAAAQTVQLIGMPEAQLTLAHATVHLATAPEVQRGHHGAGRGDGRHQGGQGRSGAAASARRALLGCGGAGQRRRATSTPTTTRMVLCRNSIRPTSWSASTTTGPPTTAPNGRSAGGWRSCGRSSAGSAER